MSFSGKLVEQYLHTFNYSPMIDPGKPSFG